MATTKAAASARDASQAGTAEQAAATSQPDPQSAKAGDSDAESIVRHHTYAAAGVGLIPIPWVDFIGLTAIQLKMLSQLAEKYKIEFSEAKGKAIIGSLVSGFIPVAIVQPVASLIKAIPLIGQTTGAITMSILGGASTYAIGRVFDRHFASGGTFLDFDVAAMKAFFVKEFEIGKQVAESAKKAAK
ncbi:DUF697 domain-containing protein [Rheinheimera sp.]|uniref:YcjF family protein n=1 Tax=Rheinheimera sp. TaxID=1869214 RepID=UPI00307E2EEF